MAAADFPNSPTGNQKYRISATRTNLLTNPNVEATNAGWGIANATISQSTTFAYVGTNSSRTQTTTAGTVDTIPASWTPVVGQAYTYSAYVRSSVSRQCRLYIGWYNGGTFLSNSVGSYVTSSTSDWTRCTVTATAPANTTIGYIVTQTVTSSIGDLVYWDAFLLEQGSELLPYFDGTFAKGETYEQSWTGTANASTSTARYYLSPRFNYTSYSSRANLIANPTFETGTEGWGGSNPLSILTTSTTQKYVGNQSLRLERTTSTGNLGCAYPIDAAAVPAGGINVSSGATYTASAYVYQTAAGTVDIDLNFFNGATTLTSSPASFTPTANTWTQISVTSIAPVNATHVRPVIRFLSRPSGEFAYVDAVMVENGSTVRPYFDGPSPTWSVVGGDVSGEPLSTVNVLAKGDLISGSGSSAVTFRTVGTNGQLLTADSSTASGLNYTAAPASSATSLGAITNVTLTSVAENEGLTWNGTAWVNSSYPFFGAYVINRKSAAYTLQLTDKNKLLEVSSDVTVQVSVPTNALVAFPVGSQIHLIQLGTGQVTVGGVGITFGGRTKLRDQYSMGTLIKRATDTWVLVGDTAD